MDPPEGGNEGFSALAEESYVEEADELIALAGGLTAARGLGAAPASARFRAILEKYQEQAQLLDPHLEGLVPPLAEALGREAACLSVHPHPRAIDSQASPARAAGEASEGAADEFALPAVAGLARPLYALLTTRGPKTVARFFPHDASALEPLVALLGRLAEASSQAAEAPADYPVEGVWEAQCCVLLWLSSLVLIPFDLATVDTALGDGGAAPAPSAAGVTPLVARMIELGTAQLREPGATREYGALMLARLLTRNDMGPALRSHVAWSVQTLQAACAGAAAEDPKLAFLVPGTMACMAYIFKYGQREQLLPYGSTCWAAVHALAQSPAAETSMLARKLAVKLSQRVGLTFLAPVLASWRYQSATFSLDATLGAAPPAAVAPSGSVGADVAEDEEFEVVEEIEELIELLLQGLRDRDTVVRWSAAKGLGRVTGRLPQALGDDVVAMLLDLFTPNESDSAWHGGCLALAELLRRGLLLPERLPEAVPLVVAALHYEVRRGPHSIGAHVRDAACYVVWAIARAYTGAVVAPMAPKLAPALLTIACYDREVNCRRAASAAFQECVGRLGSFPDGIDIIGRADYATLASRRNAYLRVAPFVAGFERYRGPMVRHLLAEKLRHWELGTRVLAADALAALVPTDAEFFATEALDTVLPACLDPTLERRHGAGLATAELMFALHEAKVEISEERRKKLAGLVMAIEKARLYRGKGGELMRLAVCRIIQRVSQARLPLSSAQSTKMHDSVDENLRHPNADIQAAAANALRAFAAAHLSPPEADADAAPAALERGVHKYREALDDPNVAVRRGYASALAALPCSHLRPAVADVVSSLAEATAIEEDEDDRDAEARAAAATALGSVACTILGEVGPAGAAAAQLRLLVDDVIPPLMRCLRDYCLDQRGDVGSWVREAAMRALERCVLLLGHISPDADAVAAVVGALVAALLRQGVERIGRVRATAARVLGALLAADAALPGIVEAAEVRRAVADPAVLERADGLGDAAALVVVPEYGPELVEGLAVSIGGLDAGLGRVASEALLSAAKRPGARVPELLLQVWNANPRDARLATPLLRTADTLATKGALLAGDDAGAVADQLLDLVRAEARGCKDIPRLREVATVLCHLVGVPSTQKRALQALMVLLVSRFPRVRKHAAEQLYMRMLGLEDEDDAGIEEDTLEQAIDVLGCTSWDGEIASVKEARNRLIELLGLEKPKASGSAGTRGAPAKKPADENESYAALIAHGERH